MTPPELCRCARVRYALPFKVPDTGEEVADVQELHDGISIRRGTQSLLKWTECSNASKSLTRFLQRTHRTYFPDATGSFL